MSDPSEPTFAPSSSPGDSPVAIPGDPPQTPAAMPLPDLVDYCPPDDITRMINELHRSTNLGTFPGIHIRIPMQRQRNGNRGGEFKFGTTDGEESWSRDADHPLAGPMSGAGGLVGAEAPAPDVEWSDEQQRVLALVESRDNVFYTGCAGTGKSMLLREIIRRLRKSGRTVAITAPTGVAATNIGGTTLHSFAGMGITDYPIDKQFYMIMNSRRSADRWITTDVLVIDEISMVDARFFDKLEEIGRRIRYNSEPFGGIQLVICGDFMQLPPIAKKGEQARFAFESERWNACVPTTVVLTKIFRQSDMTFIDILNEMRVGVVSPKTVDLMKSLARPLPDAPLDPTELYAVRSQVDDVNCKRLAALPGELVKFKASDWWDPSHPNGEKALDSCLAPSNLELKVGAQVLLVKNLWDLGLVNGSLGKVIDFDPKSGLPNVEFYRPHAGGVKRICVVQERFEWEVNEKIIAYRHQVPLCLAYALSIHKSQGQSLDYVKVDLSKVFEKGQAYVALSRATSLEGLQVLNFKKGRVMAHPKVVAFHREVGIAKQQKQVEPAFQIERPSPVAAKS